MNKLSIRISLLSVLLLFSYTTIRAQISLSAKAGGNLSKLTDAGDYKTGYQAGFEFEFHKPDHLFGTQIGLNLIEKGTEFRVDQNGFEGTKKALYAEMPVMLMLKPFRTQKFTPVLGLGTYVGYGIGGRTKLTSIGGDYSVFNTFGEGSGMKRFDFGLNSRIGLEIDRFMIHFDYRVAMINAYSNFKNRSLLLSAGYKFYAE